MYKQSVSVAILAILSLSVQICIFPSLAEATPEIGITRNEGERFLRGSIIVKFGEENLAKTINSLRSIKEIKRISPLFPKITPPEETLRALENQRKTLDKTEIEIAATFSDRGSGDFQAFSENISRAKRDTDEQLAKTRKFIEKLARRGNRAPKGVKIPNLDLLYRIALKPNSDEETLRDIIAKLPGIKYAELNTIETIGAYPQTAPNDTYVDPDQNGTWSSGTWQNGYEDLYGLKNIKAPAAWLNAQGENVVVAVIDTGVDYNHADISANIWKNTREIPGNSIDDDKNGWVDDYYGVNTVPLLFDDAGKPFVTSVPAGSPMDDQGHGTHCAGTIAATGNNGVGIIGVAPRAKIMAVKGLDSWGSGTTSDLAAGIRYAVDNGADIISCSWGSTGNSQAKAEIFNYAYSKGVVSIAAAGNDDVDAANQYPAALPTVISVAATDYQNKRAYFSNYGSSVTIAAPGVDILSLLASKSAFISNRVGNGYLRLKGTSMATPHVAGVAALVLSQASWLNNDWMKNLLTQTADPLSTDKPIGAGLVNADRAVQLARVWKPWVGITAPQNGATISGIVTVSADAITNSTPTVRVDFTVNGAIIGSDSTAPYAATFDARLLPTGSQRIRARVFDQIGGYGDHEILVYTANDPFVNITTPANGSTVSGIINFNAISSSTLSAIPRVDFTVNGGMLFSDAVAPYGTTWDTTKVVNGSYRLGAKSFDMYGHASEHQILVTVKNSVTGDTTPPNITVSTPSSAQSYKIGTTFTINATATDSGVGLRYFDVLVANKYTMGNSIGTIVYPFNTTGMTAGTYNINFTATDKNNNRATRVLTFSLYP